MKECKTKIDLEVLKAKLKSEGLNDSVKEAISKKINLIKDNEIVNK